MSKRQVLLSALIAATLAFPVSAEDNLPLPVPETEDKPAQATEAIGQQAVTTTVADTANTEQLLRAQIKARQSTQVSSEMSGRIDHLKLRDGERFSKGQLLVGFHCSMEEAELKKAKATFEKKQKTHEVNQKLEKLNSISKLELSVSKAEEDEAKAQINVAEAAIERCTIKAPFSGKVVEVTARAYQSVRAGDPLLEIINDKDLEIEFIAPSKALPQLKSGRTFKVVLDETAKTYNAEIIRLGGRVDPVSQTIKVFGRITGNAAELLPGMSGAIQLPN